MSPSALPLLSTMERTASVWTITRSQHTKHSIRQAHTANGRTRRVSLRRRCEQPARPPLARHSAGQPSAPRSAHVPAAYSSPSTRRGWHSTCHTAPSRSRANAHDGHHGAQGGRLPNSLQAQLLRAQAGEVIVRCATSGRAGRGRSACRRVGCHGRRRGGRKSGGGAGQGRVECLARTRALPRELRRIAHAEDAQLLDTTEQHEKCSVSGWVAGPRAAQGALCKGRGWRGGRLQSPVRLAHMDESVSFVFVFGPST